MFLLRRPDQRQAVHSGHRQVGDQQVHPFASFYRRERQGAVWRIDDLEAGIGFAASIAA